MTVRFFLFALVFGCAVETDNTTNSTSEIPSEARWNPPPELIAYNFDFPVGPPNANGYYNAQPFGKNTHLGDDWNGVGGGNSDLGDPIYAVGNGEIVYAGDHGPAWGNVIRMVHYLPDSSRIESLYAHCDTMLVQQNEWIKIGTQIGTIGTAHGGYPAHLHFEIRDDLSLPIGKGYSSNTKGYLDPTSFINDHRKMVP